MPDSTVDTFGLSERSHTIAPEQAKAMRELSLLLRPNHECTGSGGISQHKDGSVTTHWSPCQSCERQAARVYAANPELVKRAHGDPVPSMYDRIEKWMRDFYDKAASDFNGTGTYYENAASGLAIALQEIDRKRYDVRAPMVWAEYQAKKVVGHE